MEGILNNYLIIIAATIISFGIGFIIGRISTSKKSDGVIFVEPTEDADRERIRFVLNLELDDIVKRNQLLFEVKNMHSQNSQAI